ncbi:type I 3-dehydroquinate dehydratase [Coxiella endosymbiont of Amblyomma nuttalli]|uniref:type I 3-dehydroquinate dehydratase n=1 Tax=Coxiella endosymbiont of Amblyomma nuttalli TaxID=2749996 RepID=UPI001BA87B45|nr:type I 3-dehydroquinate dehydratase [Coxiella endosymbiont of Amblyomma nuttalli]QTS84244.1 3-dehydroquinate dehydratase [Coxiella endosymbiont of Amblyomma nuttalli]
MLNKPLLCAVVIGKTLSDFLFQLEKAQAVADLVELRVDYLENINPKMLYYLAKYIQKKAILCCRAKRDNGNFTGTLEAQNEILQAGNDKFDYLDIDLAVANKIVIRRKKAKMIISYHNFQNTPSLETLFNIADEMRIFSPDVIKFSVMTKQLGDVNVLFYFLFRLLQNKPSENIIVLGMGKEGKITRLLAPLLGSYLTFTSIDESSSAQGQIDIKTMQDFYHQIKIICNSK